jgi:hypothetical protein
MRVCRLRSEATVVLGVLVSTLGGLLLFAWALWMAQTLGGRLCVLAGLIGPGSFPGTGIGPLAGTAIGLTGAVALRYGAFLRRRGESDGGGRGPRA